VLVEPGDGPLDDVALAVAHRIHDWWSAAPGAPPGPSGLLIGPLRDGVRNPALAQQPAAGGVAVASISNQVPWAPARPTQPAWAGHPDGVQQRPELGALMTLAGGEEHPQRPPATITSQMDLGREPAPAVSQCLVGLSSRL
jgi:hypothetical protein